MLQWSELGQVVDLQDTEVIIHLHQRLERFLTTLHYVAVVICKELGGEGLTLIRNPLHSCNHVCYCFSHNLVNYVENGQGLVVF